MGKSALKRRLHDWARAPSPGRMHPMVRVQTASLLRNSRRLRGAVAQEGDDHVPGNPKFVRVLSTEEAAEAPSKAGVGGRPGDGRRKVAVAVAGDDGVNDALEGGAGGPHGGEIPQHSEERVVVHG